MTISTDNRNACTHCGCWVFDAETHEAWHKAQTELLLTITKHLIQRDIGAIPHFDRGYRVT